MKIDLTPNEVALLANLALNRTNDDRLAHDEQLRASLTAVRRKLDEAYAADYEQRREARDGETAATAAPIPSDAYECHQCRTTGVDEAGEPCLYCDGNGWRAAETAAPEYTAETYVVLGTNEHGWCVKHYDDTLCDIYLPMDKGEQVAKRIAEFLNG